VRRGHCGTCGEVIEKKNVFLSELITCGHCFSVWASLFWVFVLFISEENPIPVFSFWRGIHIFILVVFVHRISNYLHMFVDRYVDKFYQRKDLEEK
jgi:hypothetical protein